MYIQNKHWKYFLINLIRETTNDAVENEANSKICNVKDKKIILCVSQGDILIKFYQVWRTTFEKLYYKYAQTVSDSTTECVFLSFHSK